MVSRSHQEDHAVGSGKLRRTVVGVASSGGGEVVTWTCVSLTGKTRPVIVDGRRGRDISR